MKGKNKDRMTRRSFLKSTGGTLALTSLGTGSLLGLANCAQTSVNATSGSGETVQRRALGKTGEKISIIGFPGAVLASKDQPQTNALVREAIDRGINYFDVAPTYGNAEKLLGPALKEFRKDVFLTCKTKRRDKGGAAAELQQSLKTLQTDHFDLFELHAIDKDFQKAMGPGGAIEALVEAREKGLVRFLGFSSHTVATALALIDQFDFDSLMFPINWVCYFNGNFGSQVVAKAKKKGMGCLAVKAMARRPWRQDEKRDPGFWYQPVTDPKGAALAVRFALSEPVTSVVPTANADLLRLALDIADRYQPLSDEERDALKQLAAGLRPMYG